MVIFEIFEWRVTAPMPPGFRTMSRIGFGRGAAGVERLRNEKRELMLPLFKNSFYEFFILK
jgi:hypothetical protein